jgi:flavin-dependent dehydrogenase
MSKTTFDVLVIGGGPSGSIAALTLARNGWQVALVEKLPFPRRKVCGEFVSSTNLPLFRSLGLADAFAEFRGPAITNVGFFADDIAVTTPMLPSRDMGAAWGHAWRRDSLDTLLLRSAAAAGAQVFQPATVNYWRKAGGSFHCAIQERAPGRLFEVETRLIIAAHGSWEPGPLPTQRAARPKHPSDLLAFKAHFFNSRLPTDLMPLIGFPGGYGGMVSCDGGRLSVSFCIRRDQLGRARQRFPGSAAAEAVFQLAKSASTGLCQALESATRDGPWLSAGPLCPGFRGCGSNGVFLVGNAAGEAHAAIAEGITMGMQSAALLGQQLLSLPDVLCSIEVQEHAHLQYERAWRKAFALRLRASALIAHWAMRPSAVTLSRTWLKWFPEVLRVAARWTGKSREPIDQEC